MPYAKKRSWTLRDLPRDGLYALWFDHRGKRWEIRELEPGDTVSVTEDVIGQDDGDGGGRGRESDGAAKRAGALDVAPDDDDDGLTEGGRWGPAPWAYAVVGLPAPPN